MHDSETLSISPKYTAMDWANLDLQNRPNDWPKAVDTLRDRLYGRFIKFVDLHIKDPFSGFVTLAVDALIIETLQQFREGKIETPWGMGKDYFVRFLTSTSMASEFDPDTAEKFYKNIRNGLLHQAETKDMTRVRRTGKRMIEPLADGSGFTIHPVLFHRGVKKAFREYRQKLLDSASKTERERFVEKMNAICNVRLARQRTFVD